MTIERYPAPLPVPLSSAVRAGGFLFLSGVLAIGATGQILDGGIQAQTQECLVRIASQLKARGATMADVVKVTVWLADLDDFTAFNDEYARHFTDGFPTRSTVEAKLYKGALVEIEAQAWVG